MEMKKYPTLKNIHCVMGDKQNKVLIRLELVFQSSVASRARIKQFVLSNALTAMIEDDCNHSSTPKASFRPCCMVTGDKYMLTRS